MKKYGNFTRPTGDPERPAKDIYKASAENAFFLMLYCILFFSRENTLFVLQNDFLKYLR